MGWKRHVIPPITLSQIVEREPMWDGNLRPSIESARKIELSENQCGMETFI